MSKHTAQELNGLFACKLVSARGGHNILGLEPVFVLRWKKMSWICFHDIIHPILIECDLMPAFHLDISPLSLACLKRVRHRCDQISFAINFISLSACCSLSKRDENFSPPSQPTTRARDIDVNFRHHSVVAGKTQRHYAKRPAWKVPCILCIFSHSHISLN